MKTHTSTRPLNRARTQSALCCIRPAYNLITLAHCAALARRVPAFVSTVALFVNPTRDEVSTALATARIDLLQFHGSEPEDFCASFGRPYLKAFAVLPGLRFTTPSAVQYASASALLLDMLSAGHGGSGKTFHWQLVNTPNIANVPSSVRVRLVA